VRLFRIFEQMILVRDQWRSGHDTVLCAFSGLLSMLKIREARDNMSRTGSALRERQSPVIRLQFRLFGCLSRERWCTRPSGRAAMS
jgi:hypothetical protein